MNTALRSEVFQSRLPVSNFYIVSLPDAPEERVRKDYVRVDVSYIEHTLSGVFLSQSFVTFSPERKAEFAAKIRSISETVRENQTLKLALRQIYDNLKLAEECLRILEETMTDEEYETASEEYDEELNRHIRKPRKQSLYETAKEAKLLLKVLGQELSSDEIAEMLNLDVSEVERALQTHRRNPK